MKTRIGLFAVAAFAAVSTTTYAATQKELSPQQLKMKECSAGAKEKGLHKEERKTFMKECLSSKPLQTAQQGK